jgi:rare lipoprotein A (peptidoglycan hydrolase)
MTFAAGIIVGLAIAGAPAPRPAQLAAPLLPGGLTPERVVPLPVPDDAGLAEAPDDHPDASPVRGPRRITLSRPVSGTRPAPTPTPRTSPRQSPAASLRGASMTPAPVVGTPVAGVATWYCKPGRSACTRNHPADGLFAAAGPALRVGDWRGRLVTVTAGGRSVEVRLVDTCGCPGNRVIDLYASAFERLGRLSKGVLEVTVSW